jgi:phage-related protein
MNSRGTAINYCGFPAIFINKGLFVIGVFQKKGNRTPNSLNVDENLC